MRTSDSTEAVAAIRAGLDALTHLDVTMLSDQCVRDELLELVAAANQLNAQIWQRVATFDARGLSELDGFRDVKTFLGAFGRVAPHAGGLMLAKGRLLRHMPHLAQATAAGAVTAEHLRPVLELVKALDLPTVASADEILSGVAASGTVRDVEAACRRIQAHAD